MPKHDTKREQIVYPDSIKIDGGRLVRLTSLNPNTQLSIGGRKIRAGDIPYVSVLLECGVGGVRGIALSVGDLVFCEVHSEETHVAAIEDDGKR